MKHPSKLHICSGPEDTHAFDLIPKKLCSGKLDEPCLTCNQHGQWNVEIDLVSLRSKRTICNDCSGFGWVETGDDMIEFDDIILVNGKPAWVKSYR
jgi:hypothetical protein